MILLLPYPYPPQRVPILGLILIIHTHIIQCMLLRSSVKQPKSIKELDNIKPK